MCRTISYETSSRTISPGEAIEAIEGGYNCDGNYKKMTLVLRVVLLDSNTKKRFK